MIGYEPTGMPNKSSIRMIFFVMAVLSVVLPAKTTFAHDALVVPPTRLEFDAAGGVPRSCNDGATFRALLVNWVPHDVLSSEAARQLSVRIRRSPLGGKLVDVTLSESAESEPIEEHRTFAKQTECHKVLYETARVAARLLGALEKPPEPEPLLCPVCPTAPECPAAPACPILEAPRKTPQTAPMATEPTRRAFFGAGLFLGAGFTDETVVGPHFFLGFVPSRYAPSIHLEVAGAWTLQTIPKSSGPGSLDVHVVPIFGSLCYSRSVLRLCSGLTTTFFQAKSADLLPGTDESRTTLAGHVRMGAEFGIAGPFAIRVDAFAMLRFWQRSYGNELATLDARRPFGAGAAVMGVWGFE